MDWAVSKEEYDITIGVEECEITSLTSNQLVCRPPKSQPDTGNLDYVKYNDVNTPRIEVRHQ